VAALNDRRSLVAVADDQVSILAACKLVGMQVSGLEDYGRSVKVRCPFGDVWHSDGGSEASMRIYTESNHAFCFSRCGYFTPVTLVAAAFDISRRAAAVELLQRAGIAAPTRAQAWARAVDCTPAPDTTALAEALKVFCSRQCTDWFTAQLDPAVADTLTRCLALLDLVGDDDGARRWLAGCKRAMQHRINLYQAQSCR
jgi:hypothetical protein